MLMQTMPYFEARPPKNAPVWSYDLIAASAGAGRVFDDRRPSHPTPLRHATNGVLLTPDVPYRKGGHMPLSWIYPDQDVVRLRCWTRKPRHKQSGYGDGAAPELLTYAACLSRPALTPGSAAAGDGGEDGGDDDGEGGGSSGGAVSGYIEEVTLRAPQWSLAASDMKALAEAEEAEKVKGRGGRPDAGVAVDCSFDPVAGHWKIVQFHTKGTDGKEGGGGGGAESGGGAAVQSHLLSSVGEVMALLQRRAEGIGPDEIVPPSHRTPGAKPPASAAASAAAAAAAAAPPQQAAARSSSASSASAASSAAPKWGPGAKRGSGSEAAAGGDGDEHPWIALQSKDPRFAAAVAESKHLPPV